MRHVLAAICYSALGVAVGLFAGWTMRPAETPAKSPPRIAPCVPDGTLLLDFVIQNRAGRDGAGLNVVVCVEDMAIYHGVDCLKGFSDWATKRPGGSNPERLSEDIATYAATHAFPPPKYEQGCGECLLPNVEKWHKKGRLVMVADKGGLDSRYHREVKTSAIVCYIDNNIVCLHDPNWTHGDRYEWITRKSFDRRFDGWYFVFPEK